MCSEIQFNINNLDSPLCLMTWYRPSHLFISGETLIETDCSASLDRDGNYPETTGATTFVSVMFPRRHKSQQKLLSNVRSKPRTLLRARKCPRDVQWKRSSLGGKSPP